MDIDLVHFGIVVVLNMMVGLTLPPHGLLLFVMSGLTRTPLSEIFREVPPFIVAMLANVIAVTFFPKSRSGCRAPPGLIEIGARHSRRFGLVPQRVHLGER